MIINDILVLIIKECISEWIKNKNTCPNCNQELMTDDKNYNEVLHRKKIKDSRPPTSMYG